MKNLKYITLAITTFAIDMHFKNRTEKWTDARDAEVPTGKFITRRKHHNRGLPLNIAEEHQSKIALLSFGTTIILTVLYIFTLSKSKRQLLKTALSLQIGGAYSNTYDRIKRKYVVDYFSFNVPGKLKNIVFNIADIAIFLGSFLTILDSIIPHQDTEMD